MRIPRRSASRRLSIAFLVGFLPALGVCLAMAQQPREQPRPRLRHPVLPSASTSGTPAAPGNAPSPAVPSLAGPGGTSLTTSAWTAIGPAPLLSVPGAVSGRVTGIAVDPTNSSNIYLAAADGGIWQTTNGGTNWTPLTDSQTTLAMGAIAVAPSNPLKIYGGTGEANNALDNIQGTGILISNDGGATWTLSQGPGNIFSSRRFTIAHISVDPSDANVAYAAVGTLGQNGTFFVNGGTGIYKTTDGGTTWTNTTTAIDSTYSWSAVVVDPNSPSIVYAAHGHPDPQAANGVYRSLDGGSTWNRLAGPPNGTGNTNTGRIELAVAPSANGSGSHVLYAAAENITTSGLLYFGRSDNADAAAPTFADLTSGTPDFLGGKNSGGGQGWYDIVIGVDPSNSAIVYAAGQVTYGNPATHAVIRSTNSGASWSDITTVGIAPNGVTPHTDSHAMAFDSSGRMLLGSDGGIYRYDSTVPSWTILNANLATIQFYGIGLHPTNPTLVVGGSQDNGTGVYSGNVSWTQVEGGDGGLAQISQTNGTRCYTALPVDSFGANFFLRSDNTCTAWSIKVAGFVNNHSNFFAPFVVDRTNGDHLLIGLDRVYESTNGANIWTAISTPGSNGFNPSLGSPCSNYVDTVAISPGNNLRYAATGGESCLSSQIWVTADDGASWTERDLPACSTSGFNGCRVSQIVADPNDATGNTAYAVTSDFSATGSHIYKTTNAGTAWTDISGSGTLPNQPAWSVAVDTDASRTVYVSNDTGVYSSASPYSTWAAYGSGLSHAQARDLELNSNLHLLAVATHGRGAWEMMTPTGVSNVTSSTANATYASGATVSIQVSFNGTVTVTGTPQLTLNTIPNATASYSSGTGTSTLTFLYTVAPGQTTSGNATGGYLDYTSSSALTLNGGSITDADGVAANLALYPPGAAKSLSANKQIAISGTMSATTLTVAAASGAYGGSTNLSATLTLTSGGTGVSGQTVSFGLNGNPAGAATTDSNGLAVLSGVSLSGINAGTYSGSVTASFAGTAAYGASSAFNSLTVNQAVLTVVANNEAVAFGAAVPPPTGTITGVVTGDGITASYSTPAVAGSPVGAYPITALLHDPLGKLANYSVTITNATLVVYDPAVPLVLSLSPGSATAGGASFTLTVNGANFTSGSVVLWNGAARTTALVSGTQLTATIFSTDLAAAGTNLVTVANAAPNAGTSAAQPFVVMAAAPVAAISGASLADSADGSGNHVLTLTGSGFVPAAGSQPGSTVQWNSVSLTTTYVSPWQISAVVTAAEYASRPAQVTAVNPAGASAGFELQ